jgi:membrane dipeptidase
MKTNWILLLTGGLWLTASSPAQEDKLLAKAKAIHERAITLDTHVDISGARYATAELDPGKETSLKTDLVKMKKGGLDGVFLAVFVGQANDFTDAGYRNALDQAMAKFEAVHRLTEKLHPELCQLAVSPKQVPGIVKTGKRVIMIGVENGYPLGKDLSLVKKFYDLGARYITLSHSGHNQICDSSSSSAPPLNNGLSEFGKQVVAEMNRLGMMVDVSHIAEKSFWDVIQASKAPIIASHSGCKALANSDRNLTDEQLTALAKNGGVIQIVALGSYLKQDSAERQQAMAELRKQFPGSGGRGGGQMSEEQRNALMERRRAIDAKYPPVQVTVKDFVDHIDHAVKVAGIDHVGIGTDFDGGGGIQGFNDDSEAMNVTIELVRRGYSEKNIRKIWGDNLLRVWSEVEKKAKK